MSNTPGFNGLLKVIEQMINAHRNDERDRILRKICVVLKDEVPHYDWVGFYLVDPDTEAELILGPYVGAPTEHTRIPFGKGICGQAAATENTFIVQDVTLETNYLSCSPDVRSEIVVPILKEGVIVGELDIDSHTLAPFTEEDQAFLDAICAQVAPLL